MTKHIIITAPNGRRFTHDTALCPFPDFSTPDSPMVHEVAFNNQGEITSLPVCMEEQSDDWPLSNDVGHVDATTAVAWSGETERGDKER